MMANISVLRKTTEEESNELKKTSASKLLVTDNDDASDFHTQVMQYEKDKLVPYKLEIVWRNVFVMTVLHLAALVGFYNILFNSKAQTGFWYLALGSLSGFGILVGAHRLWTHRSFKAHWSVRTVLMILQTMALQNDILEWSRDHRVHHKFSETDADPHNSKRGFFFAHVGWLLCRKHPDVISKGKQIDLSDIEADPIVSFQRQFYIPLVFVWWGVFPAIVPYYFWNESLEVSIFINMLRYAVTLHHTWLVNSAAHLYGTHPYDKKLNPTENFIVSFLTQGEGYHNYHHTFPWDYSASEHGWKTNFNPATAVIDMLAYLGLVTERRVVSKDVVKKRVERTGDKTLLQPYEQLKQSKIRKMLHFILGVSIMYWPFWISFSMHLIQMIQRIF